MIVIDFDLPVAVSLAEIFRMPFESTSNWTSTLGTPRGAGGMPSMQLEVAELLIVLGHRALPLEDLDLYAGLVVGVGGECLRLLAGDRAVALDELRHHAAHRLQPEAERRHIQQHQILNALALHAVQDRRLDGRTVRHGLCKPCTTEIYLQLFPRGRL